MRARVMTGLLGFASGYHAMMDYETLLMLGTDFPYQQFYPDRATVVQIDLRGEQIGRRTRVDLGLIGDVNATLTALSARLKQKSDDRHLNNALQHYHTARKELADPASGEPGRKPIHPQYIAKALDEIAADDAIFCCDPHHLGGTVPQDERQADRVAKVWLEPVRLQESVWVSSC